MNKKVLLMILDGWGLGTNPEVSAIAKANTPFIDSLFEKYPNSKLEASGLAVGLPEGQMGNSEVGHMNIGAGRVVYQDLVLVNKAIEEKTIQDNPTLRQAIEYAKSNNKPVHFIGLVSDGGVHSHINHLKGLCTITSEMGVKNVYIHAFTDGRDTDPKGGLSYIKDLQEHISGTNAQIATIIGRYYAMDRDNRWERVKLAYDAMVKAEGKKTHDLLQAIKDSYADNVTDEFILPIINTDWDNNPIATIKDGDVVISFNFRTDRGRQITQALTQKNFDDHGMKKLNLHYVTLTNYDNTFFDVKVIFEKDNLNNTLGQVLSHAGKKQIRIAETEKYPHVTFFFSGGREEMFEGEDRILCPSPKVATYDMKPEMSANEIKEAIIPRLKIKEPDFICLNFANPDMVGHTGVFEAAVLACETVDSCSKDIVEAAVENGYTIIIIADHGNSDVMINEDGSPNTAHTTNLVPCILIDNELKSIKDGKLGDIAPTILNIMDVPIPSEMVGNILV
jgi:2,3-bisphosphoglycerate-independent phosphoglycerate mutase